MADEIHVGDTGTALRVTITNSAGLADDLSAATEILLLLQKPDGSLAQRTMIFYTDGTDGKVQYTTVSGDLDQVGRWQIQVKVTEPTGVWHSNIEKIKVFANLPK